MLQCLSRTCFTDIALTGKQLRYFATANPDEINRKGWRWLKERGHTVNPCNSRLHPAHRLAGLETDGEESSVQDAYAPESFCFGCGPASENGIHLQSYRSQSGLLAEVILSKKFQAFPGIINGGIVNTIFDCHGNWTAAIALMDKSLLPRPPFTLSSSLQVKYHEQTPPDTSLLLESQVSEIRKEPKSGMDSVTVALTLKQPMPDKSSKLLASCTGVFVKRGALRSLF